MRVTVIGDSLAYGKGDEADGGIAGRLKRELGAERVAAEIENFGQNGATTSDVIGRLAQKRIRASIAASEAVVVSAGANDLFRDRSARDSMLRAPFAVAERILGRLAEVIAEIRTAAPKTQIFVLGAYNPVPSHPLAFMIERFIDLWDNMVATRFRGDERVVVVRLSDIIDGPARLSPFDGFHPAGSAYEQIAKRIASLLMATESASGEADANAVSR